jgi:hypothetical protein
MLHLVKESRNFSPERIIVMALAFDTVCRSAPSLINDNDDLRLMLGLIILYYIGEGECDPARLSLLAASELAGSKGSTHQLFDLSPVVQDRIDRSRPSHGPEKCTHQVSSPKRRRAPSCRKA